MTYEENVRAILQCCFSGYKDEIIETAVKGIIALKQDSIVINPITTPTYPYNPVIYTDKTLEDYNKITCENLNKNEN